MNPAKKVIDRLGGEANVSKITGTSFTAPYRWQHEKSKGGTGGLIPQRHHPALLQYARIHNIALSPEEFLPSPSSHPQEAGR